MPRTMHVIALFGPTGVGKTSVAVQLARLLRAQDGPSLAAGGPSLAAGGPSLAAGGPSAATGGPSAATAGPSAATAGPSAAGASAITAVVGGERPVAISADALQVYDGLQTLTGVASPAEQAQLEHRLVSFLPLNASFSAGQYSELAHAEIDAALGEGRRPIVVGGTGLYLRAALTRLDLRPPPPEGLRERLMAELERDGAPALHARLTGLAPWAAQTIDPNDRHRIVRALELSETGELEPPEGGPSQLWTDEVRCPTLLVGLVMEREALYERIDARVEEMLAAGAREEVVHAHAAGASHTARKALGFDELLAGDVEAMKRHTRNYARRQLTWMRKLAGVHTLDLTERSAEQAAARILALLAQVEPSIGSVEPR